MKGDEVRKKQMVCTPYVKHCNYKNYKWTNAIKWEHIFDVPFPTILIQYMNYAMDSLVQAFQFKMQNSAHKTNAKHN